MSWYFILLTYYPSRIISKFHPIMIYFEFDAIHTRSPNRILRWLYALFRVIDIIKWQESFTEKNRYVSVNTYNILIYINFFFFAYLYIISSISRRSINRSPWLCLLCSLTWKTSGTLSTFHHVKWRICSWIYKKRTLRSILEYTFMYICMYVYIYVIVSHTAIYSVVGISIAP